MIDHEHLRAVSEETLEIFEAIASVAKKKVHEGVSTGQDALIQSNTFTDPQAKAQGNISAISSANMEGYRELSKEPAICRVQALDENGDRQTYYIARRATVPLHSGTMLASYGSPLSSRSGRGLDGCGDAERPPSQYGRPRRSHLCPGGRTHHRCCRNKGEASRYAAYRPGNTAPTQGPGSGHPALSQTVKRAVASERLTPTIAEQWLLDAQALSQSGGFLCTLTAYTVVGVKPGG